jgi:unsaturated rhamnogalacturonyl hydrolase
MLFYNLEFLIKNYKTAMIEQKTDTEIVSFSHGCSLRQRMIKQFKMKSLLLLQLAIFFFVGVQAKTKEYDLKNFPKGNSPLEIGNRIVEKILKTPHSKYGNTHPATRPTQITYPDVCTWLGGMWFAEVIKDNNLFNRFESRFIPLFGTEKSLQPQPNHVDNNVFGSVPLELYIQTKQQKYLDLGLKYADSQWTLPESATPEEKRWADK